MTLIIGIDPGGKNTGLVLRHHHRLLHHETVTNDGDFDRYIEDVKRAVFTQVRRCLQHGERYLVAVEGLNDPSPHMGTISVRGLIGTAQVLGAVRSWAPCVIVPPGGNGSAPLQSYPPELVGAREKGVTGSGKLRHERSAWDVAGRALMFNQMKDQR